MGFRRAFWTRSGWSHTVKAEQRRKKLVNGKALSKYSKSNPKQYYFKMFYTYLEQTMPWVTSKFLWKTPQIGHWKHLEMDKISDYSVIPFDRFDNSTEVLDEDMSDCCIGELFSGCSISLPCQDAFLKEPHSKYSLTHQVIYLHIAEQVSRTI